jgi:multicomponent Na+:H+ antiporter subunit B
MALLAGLVGLLHGNGFLTGQWSHLSLPAIGAIGSPLLFDTGVFLVVAGMTMAILLTLAEEES